MKILRMGSKQRIIAFDADGVLFDSNKFKKSNIYAAVAMHKGETIAENFTDEFTKNNGVAREIKIREYFLGEKNVQDLILESYNSLNRSNLHTVQLTLGAKEVLKNLEKKARMICVSGGEESEIQEILDNHGLGNVFEKVLDGERSKADHFKNIGVEKIGLFIGDSRHDIETAKKLSIPFAFMSGYTQEPDWISLLKDMDALQIKDLTELTEILNAKNWN